VSRQKMTATIQRTESHGEQYEIRAMYDGICMGMATISPRFRGWCLGGRHVINVSGLTMLTSGGRGWKDRLHSEAVTGLLTAINATEGGEGC